MDARIRILEVRQVAASQLKPHPKNWRLHPPEQEQAMRGILAEVGNTTPIAVMELDNGDLQILDGHLRAKIFGDAVVPVAILDVTEEEGEKIILTHDPLGGMAETDKENLRELLSTVQTEDQGLALLLEQLADAAAEEEEEPPTVNTDEDERFKLGGIVFRVSHEDYRDWLASVKSTAGHDEESIVAEVRRRLGITQAA